MFNGVFMFGDTIAVQDSGALEKMLGGPDRRLLAFHDWSGSADLGGGRRARPSGEKLRAARRIVMAAGYERHLRSAGVRRAGRAGDADRRADADGVLGERVRQPREAAGRGPGGRSGQQCVDQPADCRTRRSRHPNLRIIDWSGTSRPSRVGRPSTCGTGFTPPCRSARSARNELIAEARHKSLTELGNLAAGFPR